MINQTIIAIIRQFSSVNDSSILFKIYYTQVIWRNGKMHKMCNLTLKKLHLGRLQWIDFNSCEIHLIHKEDGLRGKVCPWKSLARKCWKNSVIWKLSIADNGFLKVWNAIPEILTVQKCSNGSIICIFIYIFTWFTIEYLTTSNVTIQVLLMKNLMLHAYRNKRVQTW
jgi:hypothetical protein